MSLVEGHSSARITSIELLRLLASLGIIFFHAQAPGALIGYSGLPVFMMISIAFSAMDTKHKSFNSIASAKFKRLGNPWIFWSMVYLCLKWIKCWHEGNPGICPFQSYMILTGTSLHLWYLPFALLILTIVSLSVHKGLLPVKNKYVYLYIVISVIFFVVCSLLLPRVKGAVPFSQWVFITPSIPMGMILAVTPLGEKKSLRILLVVFIILVVSSLILNSYGYNRLIVPYLVALGGCIAAWTVSTKTNHTINKLALLSFGIYLVHPLFGYLIQMAFPCFSNEFPFIYVFLLFIISLAITGIIMKTPLRRFV